MSQTTQLSIQAPRRVNCCRLTNPRADLWIKSSRWLQFRSNRLAHDLQNSGYSDMVGESHIFEYVQYRREQNGNADHAGTYPAISEQDQTLLIEKLRTLYGREYHPAPLSPPPLDIEHVAQQCLSWITDDEVPQHGTDFVSRLTSQALAQALGDSLDKVTILRFQDFVLSTTLAYTAWRDHRSPPERLSARDLHRTSYVAGSSLLQELDRHLEPDTLERAERPKLQALFLVLFGTALGVAYSTLVGTRPTTASADLAGKVLTESPTLHIHMKERLCHVLADKLALLAGLLWDKVETVAMRARVVDGCLMGRWARSGRHVWGNLMPHYAWPPDDHSLDWLVHRPGGTFQPMPRAAMMWCPEVLSPLIPGMDASDRGKRRSILVIGPTSHGQHMYARMRTHSGSDGPSLFV
jgi:hypothetical protein